MKVKAAKRLRVEEVREAVRRADEVAADRQRSCQAEQVSETSGTSSHSGSEGSDESEDDADRRNSRGASSDDHEDLVSVASDTEQPNGEVEADSDDPPLDANEALEEQFYEEVPPAPHDNAAFDSREDEVDYLKSFLGQWALRGVTFAKVDELLKGLRRLYPELPKSYKTVVKPVSVSESIVPLGDGLFWYKGFRLSLTERLTEAYLRKHGIIIVDVNIDGLDLYKSGSGDCFWPILGCLRGLRTPFIIAVFFGNGKPSDLKGFLKEFMKEARELQRYGFEVYGRVYQFELGNFILDAPARAFVKCCIGHNGKAACEKCTIYGRWLFNRVVFVGVEDGLPRTDEAYVNQEQEEHHKGVSPLLTHLGVNMVSQFRLDCMHLVYAGVFKRWLSYLFGIMHRNETAEEQHIRQLNKTAGVRQPRFRPHGAVNSGAKNAINAAIEQIAASVPSDFNRRPRSLLFLSHFKCHELRRILLYDGIRIFRGNVCDETYKNFLCLHVGMYILCSPRFVKDKKWISVARLVLDEFVATVSDIFDESFVVYCVHCLKHMADECEAHGEADGFSAFKFENFLGVIRRMLRSKYQPLQQLAKRDTEQNGWLLSSASIDDQSADLEQVCLSKRRTHQLEEDHGGDQYQQIEVKGFTLSTSTADWCFTTVDGEICIFCNAIDAGNGKILLSGYKFGRLRNYYDYPLPSSQLGTYLVSDLSENKHYWELQKFNQKCALYPFQNSFVCIPLLGYGSQ